MNVKTKQAASQGTKRRRLTRSRSQESSTGTSVSEVWALPAEEVANRLNTNPNTGLSSTEVRARCWD